MHKFMVLSLLVLFFAPLIVPAAIVALPQPPVDLGTAGNFMVISKTAITNSGVSNFAGPMGASPAGSGTITGLGLVMDGSGTFSTSSQVLGNVYASNYTAPTPTMMDSAVTHMQAAYANAAARTAPDYTDFDGGLLAGQVLAPGLYKYTTGVSITGLGVTVTGTASDVWIFQINGTLIVADNAVVTLGGNAQASNIFWQVSSQTVLGTGSAMKGIILGQGAITFNSGAALAGRALSQHNVTTDGNTVSLSIPARLPVNLGTADNFAILAKTGISVTGTTHIVGNIGVSPAAATYITGFGLIMDPSGTFSTTPIVTGNVYAADYTDPTPSNMTTAVSAMETAYTDAAGRTTPDFTELYSGDLTGQTLVPGLYKWGTGVLVSAGGVTISGSATDVWIFQIAQNLELASGAHVTLGGSALASNIFWQVAGQVTLGTTSVMKGILLCQTAIVMSTGATLDGKALAQSAVTLDANGVNDPSFPTLVLGEDAMDNQTRFLFEPNPFAEVLTVKLVTGSQGYSIIDVVDLFSQRVTTLYEGDVPSSASTVLLWSPARAVPSGIYFVRVATDGNRPMIGKVVYSR